jgi:hypothetical protein
MEQGHGLSLDDDGGYMAIFIPEMICSISGQAIESVENAMIFPPFLTNEADPLFVFSDAVIELKVFKDHQLAADALNRLKEVKENRPPNNIICTVCKCKIVDPDDYIGFGHLVKVGTHTASSFNYCHLHKSCVCKWNNYSATIAELRNLLASQYWRGPWLKQLLTALEATGEDKRK